jgi:hypothetical protein
MMATYSVGSDGRRILSVLIMSAPNLNAWVRTDIYLSIYGFAAAAWTTLVSLVWAADQINKVQY